MSRILCSLSLIGLVISGVLFPIEATAKSPRILPVQEAKKRFCTSLGDMAVAIVQVRDNGMSISDVIQTMQAYAAQHPVSDQGLITQAVSSAMNYSIVLHIYDHPNIDAPSARQHVESSCYTVLRSMER